ncbi:MAG: GAF domain-containing protein [Devosiaceae bacterium]|nr:GAF domain-containing protein [Devosiaceae bacterium]
MNLRIEEFTEALSVKSNQPLNSFDALYRLAHDIVGAKLFTLTMIDPLRKQARRIFSNMPDAYPLQGTKPIIDDAWTQQVLGRHEVFVANTISEIAEVFADYDLIRSLGCESTMNIPVTVQGEVLGTINCLHEAGHYCAQQISSSSQLKLPGAAIFLLNNSILSQGDNNGQ